LYLKNYGGGGMYEAMSTNVTWEKDRPKNCQILFELRPCIPNF